ncbi:MTAP family purine nucleoside phosphorylase [Candidatus Desantisbacteria bacterium]|nr:MTAP family purine nucleoside phosphorylase [Candidatus Desantisbacteria bacterium]
MNIPNAEYAIIGGSSTFAVDFPECCLSDQIEIINKNIFFSTPFGQSPLFTIFNLSKEPILTCKMHGWRRGVDRALASKQIFWVFKEAGIKNILVEGGVGSINTLFHPKDLIIPHDYIDFSSRRSVNLTEDYLLIMRDPFCSDLRNALKKSAQKFLPERNLFTEGVYSNTDGRHFESRAEIKMMSICGANVVGQSICPEVYLAREIGSCYAGIYMIVNYAEGVIKDWDYDEFKNIFTTEGVNIARVLIDALNILLYEKKHCKCQELRRITLLK